MINTVQRTWILIVVLSIARGSFRVLAVPIGYSKDIFLESQPTILEDNEKQADNVDKYTETYFCNNNNYPQKKNVSKTTEDNIENFKTIAADYKNLKLDTVLNNEDDDINNYSDGFIPINKVNHFYINLQPNNWDDSFDRDVNGEYEIIANNKDFNGNSTVVYITGTGEDILYLKEEIQRHGEGHELLVYFYLLRNITYYYLGHIITDSNILKECLSQSQSIFCVDTLKNDSCFDLNNSNKNYVNQIEEVNSLTGENYREGEQFHTNDKLEKNAIQKFYADIGSNIDIQKNLTLGMAPKTNVDFRHLFTINDNLLTKHPGIYVYQLLQESDVKSDKTNDDIFKNDRDIENMAICHKNMPQHKMSPIYPPILESSLINSINMDTNSKPESTKSGSLTDLNNDVSLRTNQKQNYVHGLQTKDKIYYNKDNCKCNKQKKIQDINIINIQPYNFHEDNEYNPIRDIYIKSSLEAVDSNPSKQNIQEKEEKETHQIKTHNDVGNSAAPISTLLKMDTNSDDNVYQFPSPSLDQQNINFDNINYESGNEHDDILQILHKSDELDKINYVPPRYFGTVDTHFPLQKEIQDNTIKDGVYPKALKTAQIKANKDYHKTTKINTNPSDMETDEIDKHVRIESAPIFKTINYQPMKSINDDYIGILNYRAHDRENVHLNQLAIPVDKQDRIAKNKNDYNFNENRNNVISKKDMLKASNAMPMIQNEKIIEEKKGQGVYQISKLNGVSEKTMPTNTLLTVNPNSYRKIQPQSSQSLINYNIPSHVINFWSDENSPQRIQFSAETIKLDQNEYPPNKLPYSYTFNLPLQNDMEGNTLVVESYPNKYVSALETENINVNTDVHGNSKIGSYIVNLDTNTASKTIDNENIFNTKQSPNSKYIRRLLSETNHTDAFPYHAHKLPNNIGYRSHKDTLQLRKQDGFIINTNSDYKNVLRTPLSTAAKYKSRNQNEKYLKEVNPAFIIPDATNSYPVNYIKNNGPVSKSEATFNKNALYNIVSPTKQHAHPMFHDKLFSCYNENENDNFFKNLKSHKWNVHKLTDSIGETSGYNRNNHFAIKDVKSNIGKDIDQLQDSLPANRETTERQRFKINKEREQLEPLSFIKTDNYRLINPLTHKIRSDNKVQMSQSPLFLTTPGKQHKPSDNIKNYHNFEKNTQYFQIPNKSQSLKDKNNNILTSNIKLNNDIDRSTYLTKEPFTYKNVFCINGNKTSQINNHLPTINKIQNTGYLSRQNSPLFFNKNKLLIKEPTYTTLFNKRIFENTLPNQYDITNTNKENILSNLLTPKGPIGIISVPSSTEITKPTVQQNSNAYKSLGDIKPISSSHFYSTNPKKYKAFPNRVILSNKSQNDVFNKYSVGGKRKKVGIINNVIENNDNDNMLTISKKVDMREKEQNIKDKNGKDMYQISMQNDMTENTIPTNTLLTVNPESSSIEQPFSSYSLIKDDIPSRVTNFWSDGNSSQNNLSLDDTIELDQNKYQPNNWPSSYTFDFPLQKDIGNKPVVENYPNENKNALDAVNINVNTDVGGNSKFGSNIVNLAASTAFKNIDNKYIFYTKQSPNTKFIRPLLSKTNHTNAFPYHAHKLPNNIGYRSHKDKLQLRKQDGDIINTNSDYKNVLRTPLSTAAKNKSRDQNEKYLKEVNLHPAYMISGITNSYPANYIKNNVPVPKSKATFNKNALYNIVSPTKQHAHPMFHDKLFSCYNENENDDFFKNLKSHKWNVHKLTDSIGETSGYNRNNHFAIKDVKSNIGKDIDQLQDSLPANEKATEEERFKIGKETKQLEPLSFIKTDSNTLITDKRRSDNKVQMHQSPSFLNIPGIHKLSNNKKKYEKFGKLSHYFQIPNKGFNLIKVLDPNKLKDLNRKPNFVKNRATYSIGGHGTSKNTNVFYRNADKKRPVNYFLPTIDKIQNTGYLKLDNSPFYFDKNQSYVHDPSTTPVIKKTFESNVINTHLKSQDIIDSNKSNISSKFLTPKHPAGVISMPFSTEITKATVQHSTNAYKSFADVKATFNDHYYSTGCNKYNDLPSQVLFYDKNQHNVHNNDYLRGKCKKGPLKLGVARAINLDDSTISNEPVTEYYQGVMLPKRYFFDNKINSMELPNQRAEKTIQLTTTPEYIYNYLKTPSVLPDIPYSRTNPPQTVLLSKLNNTLPMSDYISRSIYLPYHGYMLTTLPSITTRYSEIPSIPGIRKMGMRSTSLTSPYSQNNPSHLPSNVINLPNPFIPKPIIYENYISTEGIYETPTAIEPFSGNTIKVLSNPFNDQSQSNNKIQMHQSLSFLTTPRIPNKPSNNQKKNDNFEKFTQSSQISNKGLYSLKAPDKNNYILPSSRKPNFAMNHSTYSIEGPGTSKNTNVFDINVDKTYRVNYYPATIDKIQNTGYLKLDNYPFYFDKHNSYIHEPTSTTPFIKKIFESNVINTLPKSQNIKDNNKSNIPSKFLTRKQTAGVIYIPFSTEKTKPIVQHSTNISKGLADIKPPYNYFSKKRNNAIPKHASDLNQVEVAKHEVDSAKYWQTMASYSSVRHPVSHFLSTLTSKGGYKYFQPSIINVHKEFDGKQSIFKL